MHIHVPMAGRRLDVVMRPHREPISMGSTPVWMYVKCLDISESMFSLWSLYGIPQ